MNMNETTLNIVQLVYGGNGMGRLANGKAVFVPGVLPGEKVRVRLYKEQKGYAQAELLEILEPSEDRIQPRCPHFGSCGGCHYQHMPYPSQLNYKQVILTEQFLRLGNFPNPPLKSIVPSPVEFNYRNNVQFHISPNKTLGFQATASNRIVGIKECHIAHRLLEDTRNLLDIEELPGLDLVELRCGLDDDVMMILESQQEIVPEFETKVPISAIFRGSQGGEFLLSGSDVLLQEVMGKIFAVSPGSFFQVNLQAVEKMLTYIITLLPSAENRTVMDLYCGVGLFSSFFAPCAKKLIAIESSPSACQDYAHNLDTYNHIELYQGNVENILPYIDASPSLIIADPPRGGMGEDVIKSVLHLSSQTLAYVSCDPATLARDSRFLVAGGYSLTEITPFDFFPQTYHIETVALFKKE